MSVEEHVLILGDEFDPRFLAGFRQDEQRSSMLSNYFKQLTSHTNTTDLLRIMDRGKRMPRNDHKNNVNASVIRL
jgi:hypothetical protein